MKAVAVFTLMLGLVALYFGLFRSGQTRELREAKARVLAVNYAIFRNAAHQYVYLHPNTSISMVEIPQDSLTAWLPNGWQPMREWRVRVENQICYVFGPADPDEIDAVRRLHRGFSGLGRSEGGQLVPNHNVDMPVPDSIPNGNVVSMTEVNP